MALAHFSARPQGILETFDPSAVALVSPDRELTYHDLQAAISQRTADFQRTYSRGTLLHLPFRPTIECVISYLAAISAQMPLLITAPFEKGTPSASSYLDIIEMYRPAAAIDDQSGQLTPYSHEQSHSEAPERAGQLAIDESTIHPDIAVLLATSGSTGSKKLVKLSVDNLLANAQAIAHGLGISAEDRGITLLPLHYSFGLSVLNSHLVSGATIVVDECSVADQRFGEVVERCGVTNIGVVPHMLHVLRTADGGESLASARLVYQAGGKLDAADVTHWHRYFASSGTDFRVMYGQTEATARMTIMPADLMEDHPEAVGTPLLGHDMRVAESGELIFSGRSVMLGYAQTPDDLRVGRTISELHTGDLGEVFTAESGVPLVRITGRASDFVKLAGVRISCEQIRRDLAEQGITACVTGDDTALRVTADAQTSQTRPDARAIEKEICTRLGLVPSYVRAVVVPALPLLDNGKVDRRRCAAIADAAVTPAPEDRPHRAAARTTEQDVMEHIARALGQSPETIRRDLSFVDNGGSSLSFVPVAMAFAQAGIELPTGWHSVALEDLFDQAPTHAAPEQRHRGLMRDCSNRSRGGAPCPDTPLGREAKQRAAAGSARDTQREQKAPSMVWLDAPIVLRAICAITIVLTHASPHKIMGGAHSLLVIAGLMMGTFGLTVPSAKTRLRSTARSLVAVAVPTIVIVLVGMIVTGRYGPSNLLFIHWWKPELGGNGSLWFIESYLLGMAFIAGFFAIPRVYRFYQRQPFWTSVVLTAVLLAWRFKTGAWDIVQTRFEPPGVVWFIAAGIMIAHARRVHQKLIAAAIVVGGSITLFEHQAQWAYVMFVCAILLLDVRLPVPQFLVKPVGLIASASLYIYLIQFDILDQPITEFITVPASFLAGIALWKASTALVTASGRWLSSRRRHPNRVLG